MVENDTKIAAVDAIIIELQRATDPASRQRVLDNLNDEMKLAVKERLECSGVPRVKRARRSADSSGVSSSGRSPSRTNNYNKRDCIVRSDLILRRDLRGCPYWLGGKDPHLVEPHDAVDTYDGLTIEDYSLALKRAMPFVNGEVETLIRAEQVSTQPAVPMIQWNKSLVKMFGWDIRAHVFTSLYVNWYITTLWTKFVRLEVARTVKVSLARHFVTTSGDCPRVLRTSWGGIPPKGLTGQLGDVNEEAKGLYPDYFSKNGYRCSEHNAGRCMKCPSDPRTRLNNKYGVCRYAMEKGFGGLEDFKEDHADTVTIMGGYDHSMSSRPWLKEDPSKFDRTHCLMCNVSLRSKKEENDDALTKLNIASVSDAELLEMTRELSIKYLQSLFGLDKWFNRSKDNFPIIKTLSSIWNRKLYGHVLCIFLSSHCRSVDIESGIERSGSPSLNRACCPHCREKEAGMAQAKHKKLVKITSGVSDDEFPQFYDLRRRMSRLGVIGKDEEVLSNLLNLGKDSDLPSRGTRLRAALQLWARSTMVGAAFSAKDEQNRLSNVSQGFQLCHMKVLRDIHQSKILMILCLSEALLNTDTTEPLCHQCDRKNSDWVSHLFTRHRTVFFEFLDLLITNAMKVHEDLATGTYQWESFRTTNLIEINVIHSIAIMMTILDGADLLLNPVHLSSLKSSVVSYTEDIEDEVDGEHRPSDFDYSSLTRLIDRWRTASTSVKDRDWTNVIKVETAPKISGWGLDFFRYINLYPPQDLNSEANNEMKNDNESNEQEQINDSDDDLYEDDSYINEELESDLLNVFKSDIWTFCGLNDIKLKDPKEVQPTELQRRFLESTAQFCINSMGQASFDELALKTLWIRKRLKDRLEECWLSSMPGGVGTEEPPSILDIFEEFEESYQDFRKNHNENEMNDLKNDLKRLKDLQWQITSIQALQRLIKSGHYIRNTPGTPWEESPDDHHQTPPLP